MPEEHYGQGIPKHVEAPDLSHTLRNIFNDLLGRHLELNKEFEQTHNALRPRGRIQIHPRDIACCLNSFPLKGEHPEASQRRRQNPLPGLGNWPFSGPVRNYTPIGQRSQAPAGRSAC